MPTRLLSACPEQRRRLAAKALQACAACAVLLVSWQLLSGDRSGDQPPGGVPPAGGIIVQFGEGADMAPASVSPGGTHTVFAAHGALWVMPARGEAVRITGDRLAPSFPAWSPDGTRIAFQNFGSGGSHHIWIIDRDGRNPRQLTHGPNDDREPAWCPDGSLVFSSDRSNDGQYKIWRMYPGAAPQQITTGPGAEANPAVSPDGRHLAYADGTNLMVVALAGGAPELVARGLEPRWTPDGTRLVYRDLGGAHQLAGVPGAPGR